MIPELSSGHWKRDGGSFVNKPLSDAVPDGRLPINDCTLLHYGVIRNARIQFEITILDGSAPFHAAILFRKNGDQYLGAGVGGWSSQYSLFARSREAIGSGCIIGRGTSIERRRVYKFELEFRAGYIWRFSVDGENQFSAPLSIQDTLRSPLSRGHLGLYTYGSTKARINFVKVDQLPNRCFVITNINDKTYARRRRLAGILRKYDCKLKCELLDARDLRRERPLMRKIKEGIISSDFVIADFGFQDPRPNVLYETGIAHSLGVPTIHLAPRAKDFDKIVPSDLKAQFFILEEELDKELPKTAQEIIESCSGNFDYFGGE